MPILGCERTIPWLIGEGCVSFCFVIPHTLAATSLSEVYSSFSDVFSKRAAETLPPHRPYDCAIYLVLSSSPHNRRAYPLSLPETQAMEEYIKENLERGFIRPSSPSLQQGPASSLWRKKTGAWALY